MTAVCPVCVAHVDTRDGHLVEHRHRDQLGPCPAGQVPAAPEFTPAQIEHGIAHAIRDRDLDVVPGLLKLLAVQAPDRAQVIYDAIVHGRYPVTFR